MPSKNKICMLKTLSKNKFLVPKFQTFGNGLSLLFFFRRVPIAMGGGGGGGIFFFIFFFFFVGNFKCNRTIGSRSIGHRVWSMSLKLSEN